MIHAHDLYPLAGAVLLAERTGSKGRIRCARDRNLAYATMPAELKAFIDNQERRLLTRADGVVVCSESSADFYAERFSGPRPRVVMNAPDSDFSVVGTSFYIRAACNVCTGAPLVIYTGGVGRTGRGLHVALQALTLLPTFHLAVLGPRHLQNDTWLSGAAAATNTTERLHLLPPVRPEEVVEAIRGADVGICLIQDTTFSYRFAMPNKLFELCFAGVPMVVSDLPEMGRLSRRMQ